MIIGFIPNRERDSGLSVTLELMEFAKSKGCIAVLCDSDEVNYKRPDFFVVLGGDGTMLGAAGRTACEHDPKPLLGINLGTLGYLTDVELADAADALEKAINGDYTLEKRMMLELEIKPDIKPNIKNIKTEGKAGEKLFYALNEACIKNSVTSKISELDIEVNGEYIDTYRCDGIIICTPTGSTAYNLSAGGPILKPDGNMIAVTPVCPHTLYARPLIISGEDSIMVRPGSSELYVAMDGQNVCAITSGSAVYIRRAKRSTIIMKTSNLGFYDILRLKMMGAASVIDSYRRPK